MTDNDQARFPRIVVMKKSSDSESDSATACAEEPWIKTPQACKHIGISIPTLHRWVRDGKLKPKRTPTGEFRFRRSQLDAVLS
jgi:excisionase family DNA binding protein